MLFKLRQSYGVAIVGHILIHIFTYPITGIGSAICVIVWTIVSYSEVFLPFFANFQFCRSIFCFLLSFISVPDDFCWDPATRSFGEPTRRPELRFASIEYIASSEYMVSSLVCIHSQFKLSLCCELLTCHIIQKNSWQLYSRTMLLLHFFCQINDCSKRTLERYESKAS